FHRPFTALLQGTTTQALSIRALQLRYSPPGAPDSGTIRLTAIVDDSGSQSFEAALMNNGVVLNVSNAKGGGQFLASVSLSQCVKKGTQIFRCNNTLTNTRATVRQMRNDPNTWRLSLIRRRLTTSQTGPVQPDGPVVVTLHQDDGMRAIDRVGEIDSCRK